MKKIYPLILTLVCATACYDDFVLDYEYSGVYIAYQYDMRTLVVGEGAKFDVTAALGGVIDNDKNRAVGMEIAPELVTADLSKFGPEGTASFTAFDVLNGASPSVGTLYHTNVQKLFAAYGLSELKVLPQKYYTVSGLDALTINKGRHTAAFTVSATDEYLKDPEALVPAYAVGAKITGADADTVLQDRQFTVIAVRCENRFYGNWYHGGSYVIKDASGKQISSQSYPFAIPQEDAKVYTLTTVGVNAVKTNKIIQNTGSLTLTFDSDDITITSDDVELVADGRKSSFNGAKLLQDRQLNLNYSYRNADGTITEVSDVLYFRNRTRDGANEWQDENPENYQ